MSIIILMQKVSKITIIENLLKIYRKIRLFFI